MMSVLAAQLVLVPVNLVQVWIFWNWPRTGRRRLADTVCVVVALGGWLATAVYAAGVSMPSSPIWSTVLGSTAGFVTLTCVLLGGWLLLYRRVLPSG